MPSYLEEETLDVQSDSKQDTAGFAEEPTGLKGAIVPARRELTTSGNILPSNIKAHVESAGARRRERRSTAEVSADERRR